MNRNGRLLGIWLTLAVGAGVALAPVVFQMFSRGPDGGSMIDDFESSMDPELMATFRGYLDTIEEADREATDVLCGRHDRPARSDGREVAQHVVDLMPDAYLEMLPESGHLPWLDHTETVGLRTASFLHGN